MVARCRIACLRIPRFQIAVHQKDDPSLKGKPFALIEGKGARASVVMCSAEASKRSVVPGMKLSEAKAVCADLRWKKYDSRLYGEAQQRLCMELVACTPKVSIAEPGIFLLDASGLSYLGGEPKLCRNAHKIASKNGYGDVHIGIADSAFAATVASKFKRRQYYIVHSGGDKEFLAPLPIQHLPVRDEIQESLHELGIRTMGQMVSLNEDALSQRFEREGVLAWELARGIDKREPRLPIPDKEFKCSVDLGSPIELLNEIQFVLKSMLDRLTGELQQEGRWAEELLVSFYNNNDKFDERPVKLLRPSNNSKFLLEVIKLALEAKPIQREVTGMVLAVSRFGNECWEQKNIEEVTAEATTNSAPDIAAFGEAPVTRSLSLTLMLQRFVSRLGTDAVVRSVPNDQYTPENSGVWLPVSEKSAQDAVLPVNVSYIKSYAGASALAAGLTLRRCQEAIPVLVEFQDSLPSSITYEGRWYRVKEITQPERLSGLWWEAPVRKSYYVALLEPRNEKRVALVNSGAQMSDSGLLVLLVHDHEANSWMLQGFYD